MAKTAPAGECPKGGAHEWQDEEGRRTCSKCLEPAAEPKKAKPAKTKVAKAAPANGKKLSAIDAAAKVLTETAEPMNCKALVEKMAAKGYWTSPGGKTPAQTLYSAITREIGTKGKDARFKKTERGLFAANG